MPFRFRLQKVLDTRQRRVDAASRELAAAARRTSEAEARIARLDAQVDRCRQVACTARDDFPVTERIGLNRWLDQQARLRMGLCVDLAEAQAEEEDRRRAMTLAWQELEVLKKLRQRQKEQWRAEQAKRESLEMDEIGVQRADRHRRQKRANLATAREHVADILPAGLSDTG